jgi:hypothetical protein
MVFVYYDFKLLHEWWNFLRGNGRGGWRRELEEGVG